MVVIGHHGIGGDVNGKDTGQEPEPFYQPGFAVVEGFAGKPILSTEERSPDTARDAVVIGRLLQGNEGGARSSHIQLGYL